MEFDIKVTRKSIASHWFKNVFLVMVAAVTAVLILACLVIRSRYYNSVSSAASAYCKEFSMLATSKPEEFTAYAKEYVEQFEHKDKLEIQILDRNGNLIVTSEGFEPAAEDMPDYRQALQTGSSGRFIGKSAGRENIMAETTLLTDFGSGSNGAVRWVISLEQVNRRIFLMCTVTVLIGLGFLILAWISGSYFLRSIVRPVREMSKMARRIAMGDFDARIENAGESEIGELCDAINFMAAELKSGEQLKNDFISSVSHELRTPLTAIRGWGETAKMSVGADDEIVKKGLDVVLSESERLSGLVEELLDFSRIQSGRLSIEVGLISVKQVLTDAVNMYVELAKQQQIDLTFLPLPNELYVNGDRDKLKQVFINVIDNAIKYNCAGGSVIVTQYEEEGVVLTKVNDTGVGIPAQDIDKVKEKFFKSNKKVRGSGIGLAVADEIVKQHNGLLFIESQEGVGTTVTIGLPVAEQKAEITEETYAPKTGETEETAENE